MLFQEATVGCAMSGSSLAQGESSIFTSGKNAGLKTKPMRLETCIVLVLLKEHPLRRNTFEIVRLI